MMAKKKSNGPAPKMEAGRSEEKADVARSTSKKATGDKTAGIPAGIPTYDPSRKKGGK
jgi:hypothetical protein